MLEMSQLGQINDTFCSEFCARIRDFPCSMSPNEYRNSVWIAVDMSKTILFNMG